MKLFDDFEAVKFTAEDLVYITKNKYLYYIYNYKYNSFHVHKNIGNSQIRVENYEDITREELTEIMGGVFPTKKLDFIKKCPPRELKFSDFLDILDDEYPKYMLTYDVYHAVRYFLRESVIMHKSFIELKKLFDELEAHEENVVIILDKIKALSFRIIGKDIWKPEIRIVDGPERSSYFWIQPVRVIDYTDSDDMDNVATIETAVISIEEDDVFLYLSMYLFKYFDSELEANKKRIESNFIDEDGVEHITYVNGFEWWLTYNFYTLESIICILNDIKDTIDALENNEETEYTIELKKRLEIDVSTEGKSNNLNAEISAKNEYKIQLVIDFYRRFIYRMEYMIQVGKENGFDLISFDGP